MSKSIIFAGLLFIAFVVMINADEELQRRVKEECGKEHGGHPNCPACCKKFNLYQWKEKYNLEPCNCKEVPQPEEQPKSKLDCNHKLGYEKDCSECCQKLGLYQWIDESHTTKCSCHGVEQPKVLAKMSNLKPKEKVDEITLHDVLPHIRNL